MKLHEAEARELLRRAGLPVPDGEVATTPAAARATAERLFAGGATQVVIKAQVLVGGRGKAGGVKLAGNAEEAEKIAAQILELTRQLQALGCQVDFDNTGQIVIYTGVEVLDGDSLE